MDELVAQFIAVTDSSPQKAQSYLKVSDNDLGNAIALFFDTGGVDIEDSSPSAPPPLPARPAGLSQPVHDDDDDDDVREALRASGTPGSAATPRAYEDDEAMARRLQEEFYGASRGPGGGDEVRAPIARTTETLVGPDMDDDGYGIPARQPRVRAGIFNQQSSVWNRVQPEELTLEERRRRMAAATGGASERGSHAGRLAELFRPPVEIISHLGFEEACDDGKEQQKWILVNIQEEANFGSQILNRDIWKDKEVQQAVMENFIFLQWLNNGRDGRDYVRLYMPDALSGIDANAFPHIAIIDPRTGEQVKVWKEMPKTPIEFVHTVYEFLERYSLRDDDKNPVQRVTKPKPKPVNIEAMTEAEQLELALQNSMGGGATGNEDLADNIADDVDLMDVEQPEQKYLEPKGKAIEQTPFQKISGTNHHQEPAQGPDSTRIQFKLHDGSRVVRRFLLRDTVERLFEFVKADLLPEKEAQKDGGGNPHKEFELVSMGKRLIEVLDKTVEEAGLKMGTIMVEALEE